MPEEYSRCQMARDKELGYMATDRSTASGVGVKKQGMELDRTDTKEARCMET